jgi:HAD superfamily hydrolase (TIGR01549 family)
VTITTLLFDAGGTLVMPNFRRMADEYAIDGISVTPEALERAEHLARLDFDNDAFVRSHSDPWLSFMQDIARRAGAAYAPAAFERLRAYHDTENLWEQVIDGTREALEALRSRYRLGVISNANGTVKKAFRRLELDGYFETIVDSGEVGVEKPDRLIFELAVRNMNVDAASCVYVGDTFKVDVLGARRAGMRGVLIDPLGSRADRACERIAVLGELATLLVAC